MDVGRTVSFLVRHYRGLSARWLNVERPLCTQPPQSDQDHAPDKKWMMFWDERVQGLLKRLTRMDVEKVFRPRKDGIPHEPPIYKFMTNADLEEARKAAMLRAEKKLQMPPLLPERKEINFVFVDDPKLVGLSESKFVFTDISFGTTDRTRTIVVRDPDGKLRKATWDERARMNETYFPVKGRSMTIPSMFSDNNLKSLLEREEYEFVLDRACLQFEPDDPKFIHTCKLVFDSVNETSSFSVLRSTRHYGSLIFHLVEKENIDDLLIENMKTDRLEDATWLITLYHIIHPSTKSKSFAYSPGKELDLIKAYIDLDSKKTSELELTFKAYRDLLAAPKSTQIYKEEAMSSAR